MGLARICVASFQATRERLTMLACITGATFCLLSYCHQEYLHVIIIGVFSILFRNSTLIREVREVDLDGKLRSGAAAEMACLQVSERPCSAVFHIFTLAVELWCSCRPKWPCSSNYEAYNAILWSFSPAVITSNHNRFISRSPGWKMACSNGYPSTNA